MNRSCPAGVSFGMRQTLRRASLPRPAMPFGGLLVLALSLCLFLGDLPPAGAQSVEVSRSVAGLTISQSPARGTGLQLLPGRVRCPSRERLTTSDGPTACLASLTERIELGRAPRHGVGRPETPARSSATRARPPARAPPRA